MLDANTIFILAVIGFVAVFFIALIWRRVRSRLDPFDDQSNREDYHAIDDKEGLQAARRAYERNQSSKRRQVWMAFAGVIMLFAVWILQMLT